MGFDPLDGLRSHALQLGERRSRRRQRGHLRFDLLTLFFLALDVHVPADQLATWPRRTFWPFFCQSHQRKLRIFDDHASKWRVFRIDDPERA